MKFLNMSDIENITVGFPVTIKNDTSETRGMVIGKTRNTISIREDGLVFRFNRTRVGKKDFFVRESDGAKVVVGNR